MVTKGDGVAWPFPLGTMVWPDGAAAVRKTHAIFYKAASGQT
jgi:hypothetical protein